MSSWTHAGRVALLCCLLAAPACEEQVSGPTFPLDAEFTLAPGEAMGITDVSLVVRFNGVSGDSRCPADAICIQGGSADVRITAVSDGSSRDYELRTGDMKPVRHGPFTIALIQVTPYPFSSQAIAPGDYRVTLKVTQ